HPLIDELNWQGLVCKESLQIPHTASDQVLLWQGPRALVFLQQSGATRQLVFNFDVAQSNATRLPAFPILIHRFVESLRDVKVAPESLNAEANQQLRIATPAQSKIALVTASGET